jgi:hypothetical protein
MSWIGSCQHLPKCIVFLVGGLLSEVHFEFLQDLKAYHRAVEER